MSVKMQIRPPQKSYLIHKEGMVYAGTHLLIDMWGAKFLDDKSAIEAAFVESAEACGATLRGVDLFQFEEGGGIAGVAMLMQSHISIHSWPEDSYAAFDIFVCGEATPYPMLPILKRIFEPDSMQVSEAKRGLRF